MQTQTTPPRIIPWRGLLAVAGLLLALVLFLAARDTFDPLRRAEAQRLADQRAQIDQQLSGVDVFVAALWRLSIPALGLGLAGAGAYVGLVVAWRRWGTHKYIEAYHVTQLARVQHQPQLPALASLSYHDSSRPQLPPPAPPEVLPPAPPGAIPTFGELLDAGRIGPGKPLILGFDAETGAAIEGSWKNLYSAGVGALQGAGKSWLAAFLLTQSAMQGGRLIICDPHAGDEESLATRIAALSSVFLCDVASSDREILAALKLAGDKLAKRKNGHAARWPIIVVVDEWTSLLRGELGAELPGYAEDFAEQGRKYNVNGLFLAQGWTKDRAGTVRNRLTSHYVLRQRNDEARYQLNMPAPDDVRTLPDATGYLLTVGGDLRKVVIPRMAAADIGRVAASLDAANRAARPLGFQLPQTSKLTPAASVPTAPMPPIEGAVEVGREGAIEVAPTRPTSSAAECCGSLSPEQARALALFQDGKGLAEAVKEVWNVKGGSEYQKRTAEMSEIIRRALAGER